ncbi:probable tubulin polyglutamylase ttll-15 [Amphiura filiformis]|uniref:probable tubulin polyglutamylase ttll-15 n=1 Tax=Amphiura filiformis TaxID=82378 RepID=UPI003B20B6BC
MLGLLNITAMKDSAKLFPLLICIEIILIISMNLFLYRCSHDHDDEISLPAINDPGYKYGQPLFSWKMNKNYPTSYNIISDRLGYKIREANGRFFQCNETANTGSRPDFWCRRYRHFVHYRISNFEDADVKFTDYIPGLYEHVGYKANLVSRGGKYIPKGFHLPRQIKEFLKYSLLPENKDKRWVQKHPLHRGNRVKEFHELDLRPESIIQKFIGNPFLIEGRKFSIGVHVAFSSARPLRAYVLDSVVNLRFCREVYTPNNFTDFRSYISDGLEFGVKLIRQMDSLKNYSLKQQYSAKQSLDAYFHLVGVDSSTINIQIRDAIQDVLATKNDLIGQNVDLRSRYFQWTRWDFILDSDLKIHLMEANINPDMSCKGIRADQLDGQFCNNIVYNLFRALGIASFYDFHKASIPYVIRNSDIYVEKDVCYTSVCNLCKSKECQLCSKCLSDTERDILKSVLWEHLRRGQTRRVYPIATEQPTKPDGDSQTYNSSRTDDNALTREWLRLKCVRDVQWCNNIN